MSSTYVIEVIETRTCERCGHDETSRGQSETDSAFRAEGMWRDAAVASRDGLRDWTNAFGDLCPNCTKALAAWWNQGTQDVGPGVAPPAAVAPPAEVLSGADGAPLPPGPTLNTVNWNPQGDR